MKAGIIKSVVVAALDRWGTKDVDEFFKFRGVILDAGGKLYSVEDGDLTSKDMGDILKIVIKAEQSREYVKRLGKNVASGKYRRARDSFQGGLPPFGYAKECRDVQGHLLWTLEYEAPQKRIQTMPEGKAKRYDGKRVHPAKEKTDKINLILSKEKKRQEAVRLIFKLWTREAISLRGIARRLNDLGFSLYGQPFHANNVKPILSNRIYTGDLVWNRIRRAEYAECVLGTVNEIPTEESGRKVYRKEEQWEIVRDAHPAIIDRDTFKAAQEKIAKIGRKALPPRSDDFWLRGLVVCGHCGKPMAARTNQYGKPILFCRDKRDSQTMGRKSVCKGRIISHEKVEHLISEWLTKQKVRIDTASTEQELSELYVECRAIAGKYGETLREFVKAASDRYEELFRFATAKGDRNAWAEFNKRVQRLNQSFNRFSSSGNLADLEPVLVEIEGDFCRLAAARLEQVTADHKRQSLKWAATDDPEIQQVLMAECKGLSAEMRRLRAEAVPFSQRLKELHDRLKEWLTVVLRAKAEYETASGLRKAEVVRHVIERIELFFEPKAHQQERNRLDMAKTRIIPSGTSDNTE